MSEHKTYGLAWARCADCGCDEPPCEAARKYAEKLERVHFAMLEKSFKETKEALEPKT